MVTEIPNAPDLASTLEQWRRRLLDMSRGNRLLYFQARRSGALRLATPDAGSIFNLLVNEEETLRFYIPAVDDDEDGGVKSNLEITQSALPIGTVKETNAHHLKPDEVCAEGDPPKVRAALYRLRQRAKTSLEERGVNTLFATFGMLEWKERENSDEIISSPLLLVPITIERGSIFDPYSIAYYSEEEITLNPTLTELLRRDYDLEFGVLERDDDLHLNEVLTSIRNAVSRFKSWKVTDAVWLGHFSFLKLVMYKDLQNCSDQIIAHPFVRAILGDASGVTPIPDDLPTEDNYDQTVDPFESFHILDADSSQLEALAAADRGLSFIIQGPPGTGKSQTIANLIAQALAKGKRVLFVSEKMAALEVVHRRLVAHNLGSLCLELHSHRANKRAVLQQLEQSLDDGDPGSIPSNAIRSIQDLAVKRATLNDYVKALHNQNTTLEISAFDAHSEIAVRHVVPQLRFAYTAASSVTKEKLGSLLRLVDDFSSVGHVLTDWDVHPWRGTRLTAFSLSQASEIRARFSDLVAQLEQLKLHSNKLASSWAVYAPTSLSQSEWLLELLKMLQENPVPPRNWFDSSDLSHLFELAREHGKRLADYRERRNALLKNYRETLFDLDLVDVLSELTDVDGTALRPCALGESPAQWASDNRRQLESNVGSLVSSLKTILEVGPELATRIGLPSPTTVSAAHSLVRMGSLLLRDLRPLSSWLKRRQAVSLRDQASKAYDYASTWRIEGKELLGTYDSALLREGPAIGERFDHNYVGISRMLRPGYWRDVGRLQALHKSHLRLGHSEAAELLGQVRRVAEAHTWLDTHSGELAQTFGDHRSFLGEETNWEDVIAALDTVIEAIDELGTDEFPEQYAHLLCGGGPRVEATRSLQNRLENAVKGMTTAVNELSNLALLVEVADCDGDIEPAFASFSEWQRALLDFWSKESSVRNCSLLDELDLTQMVTDTAETIAVIQLEKDLTDESTQLRQQFGHLFAELNTDWNKVLTSLDWTQRVLQHFESKEVPEGLVNRIADPQSYHLPDENSVQAFESTISSVTSGFSYVLTVFESESFRPAGLEHRDADTSAVVEWLQHRLENLSLLEEWLDYRHYSDRLTEENLGEYVSELEEMRPEPSMWRDAFLKRFYQIWLDELYSAVPQLAEYRRTRHEALINEFRQLDVKSIRFAPRRIRHLVLSQRPAIGLNATLQSEPGILRHELEKRRRHKPIRRLFREIPKLLPTLKPCLLMSPLSVSQYLDPERLRFDLVIFDEASQVMPEEALGSIFRGAQVIIAGDKMQLPPTRFFERQFDGEFDEEEEAGAALESILDQCTSVGVPSKPLRWHYRSRDERLIAFSNRHFYGGRLITFPTAYPERPGLGIDFIHVPDGIYDRGGRRCNRIEARKVTELVMQHARQYYQQPISEQRSLGVVAFNTQQMEAIQQELEFARRRRPELEPFFAEEKLEAFFVKNLETVQGDERDVIFFSLGYGRDAAGRLLYNFGPLNQVGGERRLNVAITRAREHVKFVASILPTDLDPAHLHSEGANLLRLYMNYAVNGEATLDAGTGEAGEWVDSPFEEAVGNALEQQGLIIKRQVGCAGFRIDIGIVDPEHPGRYVLGVECDGATYHRTKTARDRDRLREDVLKGLGWKIHRVWSQDWIKDPDREVERVLQAVQRAAIQDHNESEPLPENAFPTEDMQDKSDDLPLSLERLHLETVTEPRQPKPAADRVTLFTAAKLPRKRNSEEFYDLYSSGATIVQQVETCVKAESPVHRERVAELIARSWGFQRIGTRIVEQVDYAISYAVKKQLVEINDNFLWMPGAREREVPVRVPKQGQAPRHINMVALEELAQAALYLVEENFSLPTDSLVTITARLLHYERTGMHIEERLLQAIKLLQVSGKVMLSDGYVSLAATNSGICSP